MSQVKLETTPNQRPSLISQMTTKPLQPKNHDRPSTSDTSLGGQQLQSFEGGLTGISNSFLISSKSGPVTQPMSFTKSSYPRDVPSFLPTNGLILSRARLPTLPRLLGPVIPLKLTLNKAMTSESSSSSQSSYLRSPRRLDPMGIGSLPSTRQLRPPALFSHNDTLSTSPTSPTSLTSSPPSSQPSMTVSLSSTKPSDYDPPTRSIYASATFHASTTSGLFSCPPMEWVQVPEPASPPRVGNQTVKEPPILAVNNITTGIEENVPSQLLNVSTPTSAIVADVEVPIAGPTVQVRSLKLNEQIGSTPKFRRQFIWEPDPIVRSKMVRWTETADPLPSPPPREFQNSEALTTIQSHPELFEVSTPINVDCFESLLSSHPNQPFVQSVC